MTKAKFTVDDRKYFAGIPIVLDKKLSELLPGIEDNVDLGSVSGDIYFYKLTLQSNNQEKYFYRDFATKRSNFKERSGIRIYRDNFLVRPYGIYGSIGYDWLDLSTRKAESPAAVSHKSGNWRVQANQICGQINISRLNDNLPDKSSREGIVETKEFQTFRELIRNIIDILEEDRQYVVRKLDTYQKEIAEGKRALEYAKEELIKYKEREQENNHQQNYQQNDNESSEEKQKYENFEKALNYQEEQIIDLQEEMGMLRTLATTGIVVNTYIHEIKALTTKLNVGVKEACACLEEDGDINGAIDELQKIRALKDRFNSWFKVTLNSVALDKRKRKKASINKIVNNVINNWKTVQNNKISYTIINDEKINIRCFPFDFETIINNLITNSNTIFKYNGTSEPSIIIKLSRTNKEYYCLSFCDNGPGLCGAFREKPEKILKHGVTNRRNANGEIIGTGMGLWIVNNIVQSYNGYVDLSKNKLVNEGFYISIYFEGRES